MYNENVGYALGIEKTTTNFDRAYQALPKGYVEMRYLPSPFRPDNYVINPAHEYEGKSLDFFRSHFWVSVESSDNSLFLWASDDYEERFDGVITGVLEPLSPRDYRARSEEYGQFAIVTEKPLPNRFAVIRLQTGEAYNRHLSGVSGVYTSTEIHARKGASDGLKDQPTLALLGRIQEIDDSEHGPYNGIRKTKDRSSLQGFH